ncbi:hypothetical protein [Moheibacter lacus]|uniref:GLPGLI family protein n=1 Tax=Moheibacter lacus TaxID=2745851 RepID=A0A838ZR28_9FLAO|nr:hypothetical protein [Moheibacter lacus]MBA5629925.1 hypothetical protein [Moheibacter lacus]
MKKVISVFIFSLSFFAFSQSYSFESAVIIESDKYPSMTLMNDESPNYAMYINNEGGVIRDYDSNELHIFTFSNKKSLDKHHSFEYNRSKKLLKGEKFNLGLVEITKINEKEFEVKKFKNKRKKKSVYEYTLQLEESNTPFIYVPFEKSLIRNHQIVGLIKEQLESYKHFKIKSYQCKSEKTTVNSEVKIEKLDLKIELPEKLNFQFY